MAEVRITRCICAIRMGRLRHALAKASRWPSRRTQNGRSQDRRKGGPLNLVPTGAGESRQLTHDAVSYDGARFFPDGKRLLAYGIEAGHGGRDYVIDLSNGDSKAITPEGMGGVQLSPDGKSVAVRAPMGSEVSGRSRRAIFVRYRDLKGKTA